MPLAVGAKLGAYEVLSLIGAGGMGEVYRARDPRLNREVAIKVLPSDRLGDESRRRRFVHEAQAASALNHPNIVTIHEIESVDGLDFIVMEYVRGKSLDALIPRQGMRLGEVLRIAIPVADALAAAHARGIVHRDMKPANLMVAADGGQPQQVTHGGSAWFAMESSDGRSLLYQPRPGDSPLVALPLAGGPPREVIACVKPTDSPRVRLDSTTWGVSPATTGRCISSIEGETGYWDGSRSSTPVTPSWVSRCRPTGKRSCTRSA